MFLWRYWMSEIKKLENKNTSRVCNKIKEDKKEKTLFDALDEDF